MYLYLKSFFPEENFLWIFKKCYNYLNIIFAKAKLYFDPDKFFHFQRKIHSCYYYKKNPILLLLGEEYFREASEPVLEHWQYEIN